MAIKTSSQSLLSRGSTTTAISGFGGGASSGASSTITSISYLAANGVALTANAAPTVSNSLIKIVGTGFTSGANVYLNGLLQPSANVTFVNSTELRFNLPPLASNTYSLMTFDSAGSGAVYYPGVRFDPYPIWSTNSFNQSLIVSQQLTVTGYGSGSITFSLASGNTLPSGLTLAANGLITGTTTANTYSFYVNAIDSENQISTQNVTLNVVGPYVEYLVVGGGGAGAGQYHTGGGGAGGVVLGTLANNSFFAYTAGVQYTVTIGAGASRSAAETSGGNGGNTVFGQFIAYGGGGGSHLAGIRAGSGGSGGGATTYSTTNFGYGVYPGSLYISATRQGYDGSGGLNNPGYRGGGGGGAGGPGTSGTYDDSFDAGGLTVGGGPGIYSDLSGTLTGYAGGGGGGSYNMRPGFGGAGNTDFGGGNGAKQTGPTAGNGVVNKGGGGGGAERTSAGPDTSGTGGAGGSGVVVIRTPVSTYSGAATTSGGVTYTTDGTYRFYVFTSSGTIQFPAS
jgi:hypothetical protein